MEKGGARGGTEGGQGNDVGVLAREQGKLSDHVLRWLAVVMTSVAAIVMGIAKETETVPALPITVLAKSTYSSAFIYFIVVNVVACAYALAYLVISRINRDSRPRSLALIFVIVDLMMLCLLYSSNGAATAIAVVGQKGNSQVGWNKICGVFERFCNFVMASVITSMFGSLIFLVAVILSIMNLHRRSVKALGL